MPEHNWPSISRRKACAILGGALGMGLLPGKRSLTWADEVPPLSQYSSRAAGLIAGSDVIDMLTFFRQSRLGPAGTNTMESVPKRRTRWLQNPHLIDEAALRRYRESGINTLYNGTNVYKLLQPGNPRVGAEQYFKLWARTFEVHAENLMWVLTAEDLAGAKDSGKIGVILGIQNGEHFEMVDDVDYFHGLGQRVSQLAYNSSNHLATGAFEENTGITQFGAKVVRRMNEVGMVVDLAHAGDQTVYDGIAISDVPVIVSHTNARALTPGHPRCITDMAIRALAHKGGVMGLTVQRQFVSDEEPTTVEHFVDHVDHVANLVGIEHIGIGSDNDLAPFDVEPELLAIAAKNDYPAYRYRHKLSLDGMDHHRRVYDVVEGLIRRGYSDADITAVLGKNFKRVLTEIWSGID